MGEIAAALPELARDERELVVNPAALAFRLGGMAVMRLWEGRFGDVFCEIEENNRR